MKNTSRHSLALRHLRVGLLLLFGTSISLVLLIACNAQELDGGSRRVVFVRQALAPPSVTTANGACTYTSDPNSPALFSGTVDLGLRDDYTLTLLLQSTDKAVSTSFSSAHVSVREPDGTLIREFTQTTAGFVDAGGFGVVTVIGIDAQTREDLLTNLDNRTASKSVVVHVTLSGTDPATGSAASAPEYQFPVRVCNGCLVSFETGNDPTAPVQPNCLTPPRADVHRPCAMGQDEVVSCELCVGERPACSPANVLLPPSRP